MKRLKIYVTLLFAFILLAGCGAKQDLKKYMTVSFTGVNGIGVATLTFDRSLAVSEIYKTANKTTFTPKEQSEIQQFYNSVNATLDKETGLKNGDKVIVTVNASDELAKKVKTGQYEFEVSGLAEPTKVAAEDVKKHIVVNFVGVSGKGKVKIDNTFTNELKGVKFTVEKDGSLSNGDKTRLTLSDEDKQALLRKKYLFDEESEVEVEVKGLSELAATAKDIANYKDLDRMIDELASRKYQNYDWSSLTYEYKAVQTMYQQFAKDNSTYSTNYNGSLVKVFTVNIMEKGAVKKTETAVIGYSNLILGSDKKVNVANIKEYYKNYDSTYSKESVVQLLEAQGYNEVK